eukprot:CAMPEP_0194570812 /NCGR_PEP_ID=MMETSP0292-20121207/7988_1 /TAXON_ID=39354 /ORGANISM="Heterosigma akashiwo, Strain CCMP2393" /LENGTH=94 /DNA_ID=CAMNT_0039421357 /DNA_START=32 /DNA_END=312 /DNA_ORIENTATION=-
MESEVADIFSYLESLPDESIHYLYDTSQGDHAIWACQAVLQTLPPLAKQYVMRLLAVGSSGEWIPEKAPPKLDPGPIHKLSRDSSQPAAAAAGG